MIKPTVGRVVWFRHSKAETGWDTNGQPLCALITHVWTDRCVNLVVFSPEGFPFSKTSVHLVQEGEENPFNENFAEWMPYQVGQAKKHGDVK